MPTWHTHTPTTSHPPVGVCCCVAAIAAHPLPPRPRTHNTHTLLTPQPYLLCHTHTLPAHSAMGPRCCTSALAALRFPSQSTANHSRLSRLGEWKAAGAGAGAVAAALGAATAAAGAAACALMALHAGKLVSPGGYLAARCARARATWQGLAAPFPQWQDAPAVVASLQTHFSLTLSRVPASFSHLLFYSTTRDNAA